MLVGTVVVSLVSSGDAPTAARTTTTATPPARSSACALPPRELLRVWQGTKLPARGEIQLVAAEPDYVGGGLSHAGPWDYVQEVPLLFYGPGRVPALGRVDGRATLADIAPTNAACSISGCSTRPTGGCSPTPCCPTVSRGTRSCS